ncbi:histidine kinase [Burkholderia phage BcepSauron]|uniref:Histidine kinase n=1 Tax=Burkholderia phage BcepSauron TaxID=2530033 RepID=A0A482ML38_9CAUD|nr:histidine kinase [Burkholderia phage BcepSauron]QBQ74771.1 histidine kinase [Burkholderia phage BcepSauron]
MNELHRELLVRALHHLRAGNNTYICGAIGHGVNDIIAERMPKSSERRALFAAERDLSRRIHNEIDCCISYTDWLARRGYPAYSQNHKWVQESRIAWTQFMLENW